MPSTGDVVMVRIQGKCGGEPVVNDLAMQIVNPTATFAEQAINLAGQLDGILGIGTGPGLWTDGMSVRYVLTQLDIVDMLPKLSATQSQALTAVGTIEDEDALPPNDSMCITLRTEARGPGGRGRIYLTGFAESAQNAGYWEAGAQTHASAIMSAIDTAFGITAGGDYIWGVLNRSSNGGVKGAPVLPLDPPIFNFGTGYTVHNQVRSLGRRSVERRVHRKRVAP